MNYAPIILFVYNRPDHTRKTLEAIANAELSKQSDLFIFADGPKWDASQDTLIEIQTVRSLLKEKKWCNNVNIIESESNKGLAASIISGVTSIINQYEKVIVLEDDIVIGKYFLEYMNNALEKYKNDQKVWHITGWRSPVKKQKNNSSFLYPVMDCWSWGTWKNRWNYFKKDTDYYLANFSKKMIQRFNINGSDPGMWNQIELNKDGKINTWAIFWYASIFEHQGLCLAPTKSLVKNIGFDNSGVHCGVNPSEEIQHPIDHKITKFPNIIECNKNEYKKIIKFNKEKNKISCLKIIKKTLKKIKQLLLKLYSLIIKPKPLGIIYMLHRVDEIDSNKLNPNENLKVSPNGLDLFLSQLKLTHNFIHATEIKQYIIKKNKKPFAVFTMDDGYKDNLTKALPVFEKHNCPFTIFLTTDFPDKKIILWWYILEELILKNSEIVLSNGKSYSCNTLEAKDKAFYEIRNEILKINPIKLKETLPKLFSKYNIDWYAKNDNVCLNWIEVKQLSKHPLVTIGAHTQHHYNLKQLETEQEVLNEILNGVTILKNYGITPEVFAYPFGSVYEVSQREIDLLKSSTMHTAFLAYGDAVYKRDLTNMHALPRKMLTEELIRQ